VNCYGEVLPGYILFELVDLCLNRRHWVELVRDHIFELHWREVLRTVNCPGSNEIVVLRFVIGELDGYTHALPHSVTKESGIPEFAVTAEVIGPKRPHIRRQIRACYLKFN
jgi:hypothetical protein